MIFKIKNIGNKCILLLKLKIHMCLYLYRSQQDINLAKAHRTDNQLYIISTVIIRPCFSKVKPFRYSLEIKIIISNDIINVYKQRNGMKNMGFSYK